MKQTLLIILSIIALTSCKESHKDEIARLVKEWNGKEIRFPEHPVFTILGKDTVDFSFRDAKYKVVSYYDSLGCISCKLQLDHWEDFIHEVDSLTGGTVPFVLCMHISDVKEMIRIIRKNDFSYPVFLDEKGDFDALNHFSHNKSFQTFLLDRENKIVAIGNPTLNPHVKELYMEKFTGNEVKDTKEFSSELEFDKTEIDFGSFIINEKKEGKFLLTNTGDNLLVVHYVATTCGCVKVEYDKSPIRSGDTLELTIRYEADNPGFFNKTLTVYSNTSHSPHKVKIKGMAEKIR